MNAFKLSDRVAKLFRMCSSKSEQSCWGEITSVSVPNAFLWIVVCASYLSFVFLRFLRHNWSSCSDKFLTGAFGGSLLPTNSFVDDKDGGEAGCDEILREFLM